QTASGTWMQITAVKRWNETRQVHNLSVADIHTYYVLAGATSVLVHNDGGDPHPALNPDLSSLKKVKDSQLKSMVGDVHEFKEGVIGRGAKVSHYDTYVDKKSGYLFLIPKQGQDRTPIPTYANKDGRFYMPGAEC
ncbi:MULTISPECIES: polymorphic toxin type 33 domain-containing protein, partial [unclassified Micromonospora]|uniref:polymorphic toxin type 33 domain-containing protein n=1 Tax=unclassified Micromonospora TaxID=2617518 RepID=UPI003A86E9FF